MQSLTIDAEIRRGNTRVIVANTIGVSPSGKAAGFDPVIPGSNPGTPAIFLMVMDGSFFHPSLFNSERPLSKTGSLAESPSLTLESEQRYDGL